MFVKVLAILAAGVSVISAECTYPPALELNLPGNSLTRPDSANTPIKGQEFEVVWDATGLSNSIQLILLRGPGENIAFAGYITQDAPNTGSYKWTPPCSLETDTTHYGMMIVDNASCKFQWSTQFGMADGPTCGATVSSTSGPSKPSSTLTKAASHSKTYEHEPSGKPTKPSKSYDDGDKPTHSYTKPPHSQPSEDCEEGDDKPVSKPSAPAGGSPWGPPGAGVGPWGPPAGNGTNYGPAPTGAYPSSTYTPLQSNDGARFGMSMFGAAAALAAAFFVL